MAAHNGARLKLALLRREAGVWRRRAVDEGDNVIALCTLACVKDGSVFKLEVFMTFYWFLLVLQARCSRSGSPVLGKCSRAAVLDILFGSAGSPSSDRSDAYRSALSITAESGQDVRTECHGV